MNFIHSRVLDLGRIRSIRKLKATGIMKLMNPFQYGFIFLLLFTLFSCNADKSTRRPVLPHPADAASISKKKKIPEKNEEKISKGRDEQFSMAVSKGPLKLSITKATMLALENNRQFRVEEIAPSIMQTYEETERAEFDPVFRTDGKAGRERDKAFTTKSGFDAGFGISEFLPTGTWLDLVYETEFERKNPRGEPNDEYRNFIGLTVTQALLRGMGLEANLASLTQAKLDTQASEYQLRGVAQSLLAETENRYWDYTLAKEEVRIFESSLDLADRLVKETRERIAAGQIAESEIYSAEAEAATRVQELINARSFRSDSRLRLLRIVNPPGKDLWDREIDLLTSPLEPTVRFENMEDHIELALLMRPDLNQAKLAVERDELEIVKTKNGLLPKMDLFVRLGRTGYADSFGGSVQDIGRGDGGMDVFAGLSFEFPLGNRAPKALYKRSKLDLLQNMEALGNLSQLVEQDVLLAAIEVHRSGEQIIASISTRKYQEKKLQAEIEKYRLGKSTMFRVSQAQRDLVDSQISEVRSHIEHLKSLTRFYLMEGSLLVRRGIIAPGMEPVDHQRNGL